MKKLLTLLFSFGAATALAQAPAIQWQKSLGGTGIEAAYSVQQTADGGYIVAGYSSSTNGDVSGNHGSDDFWVVKLDNAGAIQWQKALGGTAFDRAQSIQQTADGGYIIAGYSQSNNGDVNGNHGGTDAWVVKLDNTGSIQWQKSLGGTGIEAAYSVQQTADGGYIVAGYSDSNDGDVSGNHGGEDSWIVKLNNAGTVQWQKSLGGSDRDRTQSIRQTAEGGYIIAGYSQSNNGDVNGNHGGSDAWIVKLDNAGAVQWQKSLGGSLGDFAVCIQQTTDGGYITAGNSNSTDGDVSGNHGSSDYWVVKLNNAGTTQWQKSLGGTAYDRAQSIRQTADGGYIVAGAAVSNDGDVTGNHGALDFWVVKLNETGAIQWQKSLGGTGDDEANSIHQTTNGGYIIAGNSYSNNGDVSGNHAGMGPDFWVVKLGPDPTAVSNVSQSESFSLYPNPATSEISLQSKSPIRLVVLTDISGKEVSRISGNAAQNLTLSTASLANGFYFVRVATDGGTTTQKVLVQHP